MSEIISGEFNIIIIVALNSCIWI